MPHRNVEIWRKRHERLETLHLAHSQHVAEALSAARPRDARTIRQSAEAWRRRHQRISNTVWCNLRVAEGWRKA